MLTKFPIRSIKLEIILVLNIFRESKKHFVHSVPHFPLALLLHELILIVSLSPRFIELHRTLHHFHVELNVRLARVTVEQNNKKTRRESKSSHGEIGDRSPPKDTASNSEVGEKDVVEARNINGNSNS